VPGAGIEPARISPGDFESPASTNFTTRAVCSEAADYGTGACAVWHLCIAWLAPPKTGQPDKSQATGLPLASKQTQCEAWDAKTLCWDAKILGHTFSHAVGFPIRYYTSAAAAPARRSGHHPVLELDGRATIHMGAFRTQPPKMTDLNRKK